MHARYFFIVLAPGLSATSTVTDVHVPPLLLVETITGINMQFANQAKEKRDVKDPGECMDNHVPVHVCGIYSSTI